MFTYFYSVSQYPSIFGMFNLPIFSPYVAAHSVVNRMIQVNELKDTCTETRLKTLYGEELWQN